MKLNQMMLCLDCEELSPTATHCPICASRMVIELQKWIAPLSILDKPDEIKTRREALFAEARAMATKMTKMMNDADQPEPMGVGA